MTIEISFVNRKYNIDNILFQDGSKNRQQRISFFVSYQNMIFNKNKQKTIKDQNYIFDVVLVMKYKMM